jgi:hypothetical protein
LSFFDKHSDAISKGLILSKYAFFHRFFKFNISIQVFKEFGIEITWKTFKAKKLCVNYIEIPIKKSPNYFRTWIMIN